MESRPDDHRIKLKIIIGFSSAVVAIALAGILAYDSFNTLLGSLEVLGKPNEKLVQLNKLLTGISDAENNVRAYTLTRDEVYLQSYLKQISTVNGYVSQLKEVTDDSDSQRKRVEAVENLLFRKIQQLNNFIDLKDQEKNQNFYADALKEIQSEAEANTNPKTVSKIVKELETHEQVQILPVLPKASKPADDKKGFLGKVFGKEQKSYQVAPLPKSKVITELKSKSNPVVIGQNKNNSLIRNVEKVISKVEKKDGQFKNYLSKQELNMINKDQQIMQQIKSIVKELEKEELVNNEHDTLKARGLATDSVIKISAIGVGVIILSFVFFFLVLKDLTRSSFYKKNLVEAKKKAEQLARIKEEFLANMSHEIRTPLNAILGFSDLLGKTKLNKEQKLYIHTIQSSSDHLLSVVNEILDLTKIESGRLQLEKIPFKISEVVLAVMDILKLKAEEKGISLFHEIDRQVDRALEGDPVRLRQILFNLVSNAIKFTEKGGVIVRVKSLQEDQDEIQVQFEVIDSGIGISEDKREAIFDAFNQENSSTSRKFGGTGLGLSICKRLVEIQGGSIRVKSYPNKGSIFTFEIIYSKTDQNVIDLDAEANRPEQNLLAEKKILLVDDDAVNLSLMQALFSRWDLNLDIAPGGKEAIDKVQHDPYDLVITDIQMPEVNGIDVLHFVKQFNAEKNKSIRVIAFTANARQETLEGYIREGFMDYIVKPFKEYELLNKLCAVLEVGKGDHLVKENKNPATEVEQQGRYSLHTISEIANGNQDTLIAILQVITTSCRSNLSVLHQSLQAENWQEVKAIAHKSISTFKQLHCELIYSKLHSIENTIINEEDRQIIFQLEEEVQAEAAIVLEELENKINAIKCEISPGLDLA